MKKIFGVLAAAFLLVCCSEGKQEKQNVDSLKIIVWNIQNGMWSDQGNNYNNFVAWVKSYDPDVCIWCESRSNYQTGKETYTTDNQVYLPDGWEKLAQRYGHKYWAKGGHRDRFPQVMTSKYPIKTLQRIIGNEPDSIVTHGAGHFKIKVNDKDINFISVHTWPQKYAYGLDPSEFDSNSAANGGDYYRLMELTYICEHTIGKAADPKNEWWLMAGDFNAESSLDNDKYNYQLPDTRFLVHDYILGNTPYKDVIKEKYPNEFKSTTFWDNRIDFVYCSPAMMKNVTYADVVRDYWTSILMQDPETSFKHPSDHRPIMLTVQID